MKTLFVFATRQENQLKEIPGEAGEILITGIGKVNAAVHLAKKLHEIKVERIINLGICGTVNTALPLLSISAVNKVVEGDKTYLRSPASIDLSIIPDCPFPKRVLVTQDSVVTTEDQRNHVHDLGGELADMECFALAATAREFGIPFFSFKIVSDYAEGNVYKEAMKNILSASKELCEKVFNLFFLK